jgi:hypothetical protein
MSDLANQHQPPRAQDGTFRSPDNAITLGYQVSGIVFAALFVWALAAGASRAGKALTTDEPLRALLGSTTANLLFGTGFFSIGAFGGAMLILLTAGLIGGAFGFLFGLPRMERAVAPTQVITTNSYGAGSQAVGPAAAAATGEDAGNPATATSVGSTPAAPGDRGTDTATTADPAASREKAGGKAAGGTGFRPSPALTEIADWLTKIIVGVGLIQARDIGSGFRDVMMFLLMDAGLVRFPMAGVVVPACMVVGLVAGFVLVYMIMTLTIGPELARATLDLEAPLREARQDADSARRQAEEADRLAQEAVQKAVAAAEAAAAGTVRLQAEATTAREREEARIVNEWQRVELTDLLTEGMATQLPELSEATRAFADRDVGAYTSLDQRRAWAKINAALGRREAALQAYLAMARD